MFILVEISFAYITMFSWQKMAEGRRHHSFWPKKLICLQVIEDWSRPLDQGQEVCVVFFISKRHYSVSHVFLLLVEHRRP